MKILGDIVAWILGGPLNPRLESFDRAAAATAPPPTQWATELLDADVALYGEEA